nr:hypothetical protein [Tanacetum cinerariifolium]
MRATSSDPVVSKSTKPTSYVGVAGANAKDQPKVSSNFLPLVADSIFMVLTSLFLVKLSKRRHRRSLLLVLCVGVNHCLGFVLFRSWIIKITRKPTNRVNIDEVRAHGEELLRSVAAKGRHCYMEQFARCLIEVNLEADRVDVVTISIPSPTWDGFTKETIHMNESRPSVIYFVGPSIKRIVRYEPKMTISAPKKGTTNVGDASISSSMLKTTSTSSNKDNISTSDSFLALNDEEEDEDEDVEIVHDASANLFPNTKTGGSSFTAAAG